MDGPAKGEHESFHFQFILSEDISRERRRRKCIFSCGRFPS